VSMRFADFFKISFMHAVYCTVDSFYFLTIRHFFFDCNLHSLALHLNFFYVTWIWSTFAYSVLTWSFLFCWLFLAAFLLIHSLCELKCVCLHSMYKPHWPSEIQSKYYSAPIENCKICDWNLGSSLTSMVQASASKAVTSALTSMALALRVLVLALFLALLFCPWLHHWSKLVVNSCKLIFLC
jgi:hypothetical protein